MNPVNIIITFQFYLIMNYLSRLFVAFLIIVFSGSHGFSQKAALKSITEEDLNMYLTFLSSDLLQGRSLGTTVPGLGISAEYIKSEITRIGLKPVNGDYFQAINLISVSPDPDNSFLAVSDQQGKTLVKSDSVFTFFGSSDNLSIEGNLVFAGYGWTDTEKGYNDFEGVDVKDKFVIIMSRNREAVLNPDVRSEDGGMRGFGIEMGKIRNASQLGAKGVIFVADPLDKTGGMLPRMRSFGSRGSYQLEGVTRSSRRGGGNMFFITPSVAESILALNGKTLEGLQNQINGTGKPASFEFDGMQLKIQMNKIRKPAPADNVIGIIEGSDPVLKNECVVYMAHYDHVGVNREGEVYNGADDNASGVASLLEIAEAFMKLNKKPRRSVLFAWVTGEEIGLLGSQYYSLHPLFPLDKTIACLNLDMVGRVKAEGDTAQYIRGEKNLIERDGIYVVTGKRSKELDSLNSRICAEMGLKPDGSMSESYIGRSDYYHFHRNGIPILGYSTGIHEDYHQVTDEISKIDFPKMKTVAQLAFRVGYEVANKKERIIVDKPLEQPQ